MPAYRLGSNGGEVARIQTRLSALGFYRGPLDGVFGGATAAAVKAFQQRETLRIDGEVGPLTWRALFAEKIPTPAIAAKPLDYKCLALTGSFETNSPVPECFAGLSGNFDGQGLSFGVLQWNFGHDSLIAAALKVDKSELMHFAASIHHPVKHVVNEPWRGMLKASVRTEAHQGSRGVVHGVTRPGRAVWDCANTFGLRGEPMCVPVSPHWRD